VDQRGKSLLPAVIDYGAWRKGDTYVFNQRFELASGSQPEGFRACLSSSYRK